MVLEIVIENEVKQNAENAEHTEAVDIKAWTTNEFPFIGFGFKGTLGAREISKGRYHGRHER